MFNTPIALFVFNRPEITKKNFDILRRLEPTDLFVIADGPRKDHPADIALCESVRNIFLEIPWNCNVTRFYSDTNLGCRNSIPNGLDKVFSLVGDCIILEDDCIPNLSFFKYCSDLLEFYRDNEKIMTIGGYRCDGPNEVNGNSYFFSKYPSTWGWATWKRTWKKFDLDVREWKKLRETNWLLEILKEKDHVNYWQHIFDKMNPDFDAWDYALTFCCWLHKGLSVRSKVNMISNIGFGPDATHTTSINEEISFRNSHGINFPLVHPGKIEVHKEDEDRIEWVLFSGMTKRMLNIARQRISEKRNG